VVLGPDDAPIPAATVRIRGDTWGGETRTDAQGAWRIDRVAPGAYQLHAFSTRHAPAPDVSVDVDGTAPRTDLVVRVRRGARAAGHVVDVARAPVARPVVVAIKRDAAYPAMLAVRGDERGAYELPGLEPGAYDVFAHDRHLASRATELVVADGDAAQIDLVVESAAIAGVVVDAAGNPVSGVEVRAVTPIVRGDITDRLGRFDLGALPPGDYEVRARCSGPGGPVREAATRVTAGDVQARLVLPAPAA
jgi:hypothetical protein